MIMNRLEGTLSISFYVYKFKHIETSYLTSVFRLMGASHMKPSIQSEPVNLRELASGPKHVSFADETSSQSQV